MCKKNTKLLLLLNVEDDKLIFGDKGRAINSEQDLEQTTISERKFYRLKFTLIEGSRHLLVDGANINSYTRGLLLCSTNFSTATWSQFDVGCCLLCIVLSISPKLTRFDFYSYLE